MYNAPMTRPHGPHGPRPPLRVITAFCGKSAPLPHNVESPSLNVRYGYTGCFAACSCRKASFFAALRIARRSADSPQPTSSVDAAAGSAGPAESSGASLIYWQARPRPAAGSGADGWDSPLALTLPSGSCGAGAGRLHSSGCGTEQKR